ncbi:hypothetical protein D3C86_1767310 [compost metagenome]
MSAPGQRGEHRQSVGTALGLAENAPVEHHRGIGAEHAGILQPQRGQPGSGLGPRQALDIGGRRLVGQYAFIDGGGDAPVRHADLQQQFAAARRSGSEVELAHVRYPSRNVTDDGPEGLSRRSAAG